MSNYNMVSDMGIVDSTDTKRRRKGPSAPTRKYYAGKTLCQRGVFITPVFRRMHFKLELLLLYLK